MDVNRNNIKKIRSILNNIIQKKGCCDGFNVTNWCTECPLANAAKREDGSFFSCAEYVMGYTDWTLNYIIDMDKAYLEKAEQLLADIEIEEILLKGNIDD